MEVETDPERLRRDREKRKRRGLLLFAARPREARPGAPARAGMLRVIVCVYMRVG